MNTLKKITKNILLFSILLIIACNNDKTKQDTKKATSDLIIFNAGSLSVPFKEIAKAFNKEYPDINIIMEPDGSRKCARKIIDLKRPCDIMASADYKVIDNLLIPDYAKWNIKFVSNEMVIAYNEKSRYSDKINKNNWFNILLKNDVAFARADPNADPCGYRAILTIKLSEKYYHKSGIADKLLKKDLNYIRPKGTDLLALIETNTVDYIFEYRSVAEQHKLKYILIPDEINLKNPKFSDLYSTASVNITGKRPNEIIIRKGEPMIYGITILKNAANPDAAKNFIKFLLDENKGMKIMKNNGQPSVIPSYTDTYNNIPENLKRFAFK
jgi:molybdate/tungstate transport system substrate-binding protein